LQGLGLHSEGVLQVGAGALLPLVCAAVFRAFGSKAWVDCFLSYLAGSAGTAALFLLLLLSPPWQSLAIACMLRPSFCTSCSWL
jgi:hypothetical protein